MRWLIICGYVIGVAFGGLIVNTFDTAYRGLAFVIYGAITVPLLVLSIYRVFAVKGDKK